MGLPPLLFKRKGSLDSKGFARARTRCPLGDHTAYRNARRWDNKLEKESDERAVVQGMQYPFSASCGEAGDAVADVHDDRNLWKATL